MPQGVKAFLTLIRHAESTANVAGILQGRSDAPLTEHGIAQVEALGKYWASDANARPCSLLLTSPIGRATKTADAIARNIIDADFGHTLSAAPLPSEFLSLKPHSLEENELIEEIVSTAHEEGASTIRYFTYEGLAERDFGYLESTKRGVLQSGFARGTGHGENKNAFDRRVQAVGEKMMLLAWHAAVMLDQQIASSSSSSGSSDGTSARKNPAVHIVVVTHGLWINTFLKVFIEGRQPFAANTARFTLEISESSNNLSSILKANNQNASSTGQMLKAGALRKRLIVINDTSHLAGLKKRPRGQKEDDPGQSKLTAFFSSPHKKTKRATE